MFLCKRLPPGGSWRRRRLRESAVLKFAGSFRHATQRTPKAHFIRFGEPLPRATFLSEEGFRRFESVYRPE